MAADDGDEAKLNAVMDRMRKHAQITDDMIEQFNDWLEENEFDYEALIEDIKEPEQSFLMDLCRDDFGNVEFFDIIALLIRGEVAAPKKKEPDPQPPILSKQTKPILPSTNKLEQTTSDQKNDSNEVPANKTPISSTISSNNKSSKNKPQIVPNPKQAVKPQGRTIKPGDQIRRNKATPGTIILNPAMIVIPFHKMGFNVFEDIGGITMILHENHKETDEKNDNNNASNTSSRSPLPKQFIDFWKEFLDEADHPEYGQIAEDIRYNEGPTYDYLMEHPPMDRILPVLEKVVDQLKHPRLDVKRNKNKRSMYDNEVVKFFEEQTPEYKCEKDSPIHKTCVLCKRNEDDQNFNTFNLFVNLVDAMDRELYFNIPLANDHNKLIELIMDVSDAQKKKYHFANQLSLEYKNYLKSAFKRIKNNPDSFFPKLISLKNAKNKMKIGDNCRVFQLYSLAFMLFLKAFMWKSHLSTKHYLHEHNHLNTKKSKKKKKTLKNYEQYSHWNDEDPRPQNEVLHAEEIYFHNDNFPLQFDLVIIPQKDSKKDYFYVGNRKIFKDFYVDLTDLKQDEDTLLLNNKGDNNKHFVYRIFGKMCTSFENVIQNVKNKEEKSETKDDKESSRNVHARRDERYIIVIDRNENKMLFYPPNIANGKQKVKYKQTITTQSAQKGSVNIKKAESKTDNKKKTNDDYKDNKFSLIGYEYNDITNFYLTSKCLIPGKDNNAVYGSSDVPFILSAHFHVQREWHRHPKLKMYQYLRNGALRFFKKDMFRIWLNYFEDTSDALKNDKDIEQFHVFDEVFDLVKCDTKFMQWSRAIRLPLMKNVQNNKEWIHDIFDI